MDPVSLVLLVLALIALGFAIWKGNYLPVIIVIVVALAVILAGGGV